MMGTRVWRSKRKERARRRINSQSSRISSQAIKDNPPDAGAIIDPDILMDEYFDETVPFEYDETFDEDLVFEEETSWKTSTDDDCDDVTEKTADQSFQFDFLTDDNVSYFAEEDSEENDEPFFNLSVKDKPDQSMNKKQENEQANYSFKQTQKTTQSMEATQCPECHKTFTQARGMKVHLKTVHFKKQLFKCEFCDKTRTTQGNLNKHIKQCHSNKVQ